MSALVDLTNNRYEKLLVLKKSTKKDKSKNVYWECICDCGETKTINGICLRRHNFTKSCGCLNSQKCKERAIKRNYKHGKAKTYFWQCWYNLKRRCVNPKNINYKYYGGRGITYDPKWEHFLNFKKDMWYKYTKSVLCHRVKKPSIERINVNGNYNKENCIFIELKNQAKNKRRNNDYLYQWKKSY